MVILGTMYAGEMKKGILTLMMYQMPLRGQLCLHSSANEDDEGNVTVFFGLSGTGKTTLSADPRRKLIGDDEHVWTADGVELRASAASRARSRSPRRSRPPPRRWPPISRRRSADTAPTT